MSRNQIIEEMARELISAGEDIYQEIRLCFLAETAKEAEMRNFVNKLFDYTDARRLLLIGMKES